MMGKKGFTLLEIIVTVISMLIIVTFGLATYRQVVDSARQRVCETNLKVLEAAVEISVLEMGILGKLEELNPEYLNRAYARIMEKEGWPLRLAYFLVKLTTSPQAYAQSYAQFLTPENLGKYGADPQIFRCPADDSPEVSYAINESLLNSDGSLNGLAWDKTPSGVPLIAECDEHTFKTSSDFSYRHIKKMGTEKIAKIVEKDREVKDVLRPPISGKGGGGKGKNPSPQSPMGGEDDREKESPPLPSSPKKPSYH